MKQVVFNKAWTLYKSGEEQKGIRVDLPHDAQISETRSPELPMDSGYFPGGKYTYVKNYECPKELSGETVYLEFDGVYMNGEIWVNGEKLAFQPYGYTNFLVPIHEKLKFGDLNEIKVIADNSQFPNARWYTGAGIYRNVTMHIGNHFHIQPYGIKIDTLSCHPAKVGIKIDAITDEACEVKTTILFGGKKVAEEKGLQFETEIPDAHLWSDKAPNLYTAHVQVLREGVILDESWETFGIRKIECDASFGLKINGEEVLLRGGCVHHDNGLLGACAFSETEERKVRKLKEAGFNAIRSSHNMCSKEMLKACDLHGMYLMDEFVDMWIQHKHKYDYATQFPEWYERDLTSMIRKDYNHPSVILYSIGNEVGESATPEGLAYARKMTELVHNLDKSRPVTCGINLLLNGLTSMGKGLYQGDGMQVDKQKNDEKKTSGSTFVNGVMSKMGGILNYVGRLKKFDQATKDVFEILDVAGYNYGSGRYKVDPKQYPDRITVGSETFPPSLYKNWKAVKTYPNLIGDFMWTAWDYLGEAGIGVVGYGDSAMLKPYPTLLAGCGVIDITGEFRPEVYWNQMIWGLRKKPYLAVDPLTHSHEKAVYGMWRNSDARHSWSWNGFEGEKTNITVYAAGSYVELFLNGRSLGKKRIDAHKAVFHKIAYAPGELKAIAYHSSGKVIGEDILCSAKTDLVLSIKPEEEKYDPGKLLYVNIYLTDRNGIREFGKDVEVSVSLEGGTLIALGSANPAPVKSYQESSQKTYYGCVQAIISPDSEKETMHISAAAKGIEKGSVTIHKQS